MPYTRGTIRWAATPRFTRLPDLVEDAHNRVALRAVTSSIADDVPLILMGDVGVGKSTLMAYIDLWTDLRTPRERFITSRLWLAEPNWWASASDYCADVKDGWDHGKAFPDWGDWYSADGIARVVRRLFIDDLGVERETAENANLISELVERRYAADLPTWITTNLTQAEIGERYGERTLSRLLGSSAVVLVGGRDRRMAQVAS